MSEFDLIRAHFARLGAERGDVILGVGDDCALLRVPAGQDLAVSIDTLVAGVHFLPEVDPEALGHKCLAVGLSDLAAIPAAEESAAATSGAEKPAPEKSPQESSAPVSPAPVSPAPSTAPLIGETEKSRESRRQGSGLANDLTAGPPIDR